jgi:hypothetical protein
MTSAKVIADTTTPSGGVLGAGGVVTFTVAMSEVVTVSGTPTLTLNDGSTATYVSGSGTNQLVFSTTIADGQQTTDLAVTGVALNGGSVTDGAGNAANLSSVVAPLTGTLAVNPVAVTAIAAAPSVAGPLGVNQSVTFTATVGQAVTINGTPTLTLNNGGVAAYVSGSGTNHLVFNYTVAAGQDTGDLKVTGLDLNGGTVSVPSVLSFGTATSFAAGNTPISVTAADLTGNGVQSLIVADLEGGVDVLLGNGQGGFGPATSYALGTNPESVTTADVNGDGVQDLIVADSGDGVDVLLGDGQGRFGPATSYAAGDNPVSVVAADLTGNGVQSLVVADYNGGVDVLLGDGQGGFGPATSYDTSGIPIAITTADLTGNGVQDLIVADLDYGVEVLLGNGSGSFGTAKHYDSGASSDAVTTADVNGDGKIDLIIADSGGGVDVLLGTGSGGFGKAKHYAAGSSATSVATADLTGNGVQDIIVTDATGGVYVLLGNGQGGFGAAIDYPVGSNPYPFFQAMTVADVNGDGKPDVVIADYNNDVVDVLANSSTLAGVFDPTSPATASGADTGLVIDTIACFYPGTRLASTQGEIAVEEITPGTLLRTLSGALLPVRWLGRSPVSTRFADPLRCLPIRITAGALGEGLPTRDLLLSPCHALFIGGVLVQAGALVNGGSILRESGVPETFTYYHIELATHELLLAEGAATESFVDNVDRMNFINWAEREALGSLPPIEEMGYPRAQSHRQVPLAVRVMLAGRLAA